MNTVKRLIHHVHMNWFLISLLVLGIGSMVSLWSTWLILIPVGVFVLFIVAANNDLVIFAPWRQLIWPQFKDCTIKTLQKGKPSSLVLFPFLLWLEGKGKYIFIEKGYQEFAVASIVELDRIGRTITSALDKLSESLTNQKPLV
jgi:hypothetical protein